MAEHEPRRHPRVGRSLALAAEDPTLLLGTTNTGDWHKDSPERRRRRNVDITISEELRFPSAGRQPPTALSPSERMPVDVLMPVKHGAYIRGDVVSGLLAQDRPLRWFVDAAPDIEISREDMDLVAPAIPSLFWRRHARRLVRILAKRNRLSKKGDAPLVYLADADVILPPGVLGGMADAVWQNAELGATGLIFQVDSPHNDTHVPAGAMMIRRQDLAAIGPLRGSPCECCYIRNRLADMGKVVIPVDCIHAHQWKRTVLDSDVTEGERDEEDMDRSRMARRRAERRGLLTARDRRAISPAAPTSSGRPSSPPRPPR